MCSRLFIKEVTASFQNQEDVALSLLLVAHPRLTAGMGFRSASPIC